ncbi:MAG: hypothetical protein ACREME_08055, partial [Gemmatimonadales bacterium]
MSRPARLLAAIAALSFAAIVLLYAFPPGDRGGGGGAARSLIANLSWLWASGYAAACCFYAARRIAEAEKRRTWRWIGVGCVSFLVGQLAWGYYELGLGVQPPYPSLADAGYLGMYVCIVLGLATLVRGQPTRRADPELILDIVLVTFTAGALTYHFFLDPLFAPGGAASLAALWASIAWSVGGVAVLWIVLIQMLRRTVFPTVTTALILPGVVVFAVGDVFYAIMALRGTYQTGGVLDLSWDAGLLMIAAAAALAPERALHGREWPTGVAGLAGRLVAILVGLAGMTALAVVGTLRAEAAPDLAIIGMRVLYSLGVDRRYARLLEDEVAGQTRSLMEALGATASAERSLRLVMESVPDAITVLDQEGRVLDGNIAGRALMAGEAGFAWLDAANARLARENLGAAFAGKLC